MSQIINPIQDGDLEDVLHFHKREISKQINCVKPGEIQVFNAALKTAQIKILYKRVYPNGSTQDYPALIDCPVVTIQGGGGGIEFPIVAGDQCLVFFADRNIDAWFATGKAQPPYDSRAHDLSDGFALVGINYLGSAFKNYSEAGAAFFNGAGAEIDLIGTQIKIFNATTTLMTLLNNLISAITSLQVTGPLPLTPASITAITAVQTQLQALLL